MIVALPAFLPQFGWFLRLRCGRVWCAPIARFVIIADCRKGFLKALFAGFLVGIARCDDDLAVFNWLDGERATRCEQFDQSSPNRIIEYDDEAVAAVSKQRIVAGFNKRDIVVGVEPVNQF